MATVKPLVIATTGQTQRIQSADTLDLSTLGTGTPSSSTYLRGDGTWQVVSGGGTGVGSDPDFFLNNQLMYLATTSLTDSGVSVASNHKGIVRSIQITNTTAGTVYLTANITYSANSAAASLGTVMPVPPNTSVELLERPKVISNSDTINLMCDTASALYANVVWQDTTDTTYVGGGINLTTNTETVLYVAAADTVIKSLLLSNSGSSPNNVTATVALTDGSDVFQGYLCDGLVIPLEGTVEIAQSAKFIPSGYKLKVTASDANRLDVHYSGEAGQTPNAAGTGTVTSVSGSGGSTGLTLNGGPITTTGTLTLGGILGITNGGTGAVTANSAFNALVPSQSSNGGKYLKTDGNNTSWATVTTGTVTSVGLSDGSTSPIYTISGSPVTSSGTLTFTLNSQTANQFFAAPNGSSGQPGFRAIVTADIPTLNQNTTGSAAKWTTARNLAGNSVDGSADVAFSNKFIVQGTTDAGLSGAQFLGALGTGIVKNTTTTGVLSIAVAGDFPTLNQSTTGNAATATTLQTARNINGTSFDGSANIVIGQVPSNNQTGTTYTFVLTDAGKFCTFNNASPVTVTVPPNSGVAFAVDTQIEVCQLGAGKVTFVAGAGVTILSQASNLSLAAQYAGAILQQTTTTNTWLLIGNLST